MKKLLFIIKPALIALICLVNLIGCKSGYYSPVALAADSLHQVLYIAGATSNQVVSVNLKTMKIGESWTGIPSPSGLALMADGSGLFVTSGIPEGRVTRIEPGNGTISGLPAGHTPMSPVLSPDGKFLYICNRFNNDVWLIDIEKKEVEAKIPVLREPVGMTMDNLGRFLYVANHLPAEVANTGDIAAAISVIDMSAKKVIANIRLPDGSSSLRGICISPDSRYVYVTHILARYQLPTTQLERGWMNTNALSIIDTKALDLYATILLDDVDRGAANPWAVGCSADGRYICITHAGTHEMSVIDAPGLFEKLKTAKQAEKNGAGAIASDHPGAGRPDISTDLAFLVDIRRRIALNGKGPRSLALMNGQAFIGDYFSDGIESLAFGVEKPLVASKMLKLSDATPGDIRQGEMIFNDATTCFQNWQSCSSCHPDVRADGLNWDLLNDGVGNPKNTKSLLLCMQTPPAMITGIRDRAEIAVRSGLKFIQFAVRPEADATKIDAFLRALKPVPSPFLLAGKLSPAAERGRDYFKKAGCAACHPEPLFTDLKKYDVGTGTGPEKNMAFDTPTLVEVWRTAPYLYNGRAYTIKEVLIDCNRDTKHGNIPDLNNMEIQDLIEYILSL